MFLTSSWLDLYAGFSKSLLSIGFFLFSFFLIGEPFEYFFQNGFCIAVLFQCWFVGEILDFPFDLK